MSKKEHIDKLFKDSFKEFEATPSPEVWNQIQAKLKEEKDDRKVIPIWWKLGGVAALIALLLTVGNSLFVNNSAPEIVTEDSSKEIIQDLNSTKDSNDLIDNSPVEIVDANDASFDNALETNQTTDETTNSNRSTKMMAPETGVTKTTTQKGNKNSIKTKTQQTTPQNETRVAVEASPTGRPASTNQKNPLFKEPQELQNSEKSNTAVTDAKNAQVKNPETEKEAAAPSKITNNAVAQESEVEKASEKVEESSNKKSIFDAIEEQKEEAIAQQEKKKHGGWEVTPNVGPVYYNSLSGGSSIDPSFSDNSQTGEVNFSYGVQVAYEVTDRLSIRSGVNNVNVGYATGGIELASGPASFGLKSVDYGNSGRNVLSAFDKGTIPAMPTDPNNPYGQLNLKSTSGNAEIRQSITYYEVPLEAKYVLVNRRFGVNMIGGFSTLFLGDSEISVNDADFRSVLGASNNLNDVSFSTNIGLGFDYKISEKFKFNIEPMFKYQLNPYTDASIDFRPYYFGVFSGVSFKF